jgi:hypothetical protein
MTRLARAGVRFEGEGDRLKVDAPAGVLTDADRRQLAGARAAILGHLAREGAWDRRAAFGLLDAADAALERLVPPALRSGPELLALAGLAAEALTAHDLAGVRAACDEAVRLATEGRWA